MTYASLLALSLSLTAHADLPGTTGGQPLVFTGLIKPKAEEKPQAESAAQIMQALSGALGAGGAGKKRSTSADEYTPIFGTETPSPEPGADTDWDNYSYPKDHVFQYGGRGGGDIGNGMCTAKNANRVQVANGYCAMLSDALNKEGSCANREMKNILAAAGSNGAGIGDLNKFCSTFPQLQSNTQRTIVFQQILAGLITKESGWNPRAAEKPWTRADGASMGGKGLFQIGVNDANKDADCNGLNPRSIMNPETNIKCGACIALKALARDRTIGHGVGDSGARGLASYFGPFRDGQSDKRVAIANSTNQYCVAATGGGNSGQMAAVTGKTSGRGTASN